MKCYRSFTISIVLVASLQSTTLLLASPTEGNWMAHRESLADYEVLSSSSAQSRIQCVAAASQDSAVQLVAFNSSSSMCTHYKCRLGLSHCRKCRNLNKGAQQVWATNNECWTTVQHRVSDSVDFYRNWSQYQSEFGEGPDGNYWIGLSALRALTYPLVRKLRFLMTDWSGSETWAEYSSFSVGAESDKYRLNVSGFSGSASIGDAMSEMALGSQFSTFDAQRDTHPTLNCALAFAGGWWFANCFKSHPNGRYMNFPGAVNGPYGQGIIWVYPYGLYYSLKEIEMLIL